MAEYTIAFIYPRNIFKAILSPPLGLLRLASLTPKEFDVKLIDENVEKHIFKKVDIAAITVQSILKERAYEIADKYREMGVKVILGGIHPSYMPEEAKEHADSVVIGEADSIWKDVLDDFKKNELKDLYKADRPDLKDLPLIDWDLIKGKRYFNRYVLQTSRGCPFGCDFCSVSLFNGRKVRHRPVEDIVREVKNIKARNRWFKPHIFFADDNIAVDKEYAKGLFKALIPLKIRWFSQVSINLMEDDEMLDLAAESGCRWLFIGFESIMQDSLDEVHKPFKTKKYEEVIKKIKQRNIMICASFIFGFDSDDKEIFERTVNFCDDNDIDFVVLNALTTFPGTNQYERFKEEGRILDHYKVKPKNMSDRELLLGIMRSYKKFYSLPLIMRRTGKFFSKNKKPKSLLKYVGLNLVMGNAAKKHIRRYYKEDI